MPRDEPLKPLLAVADVGWYTTEHLFRAVDPARSRTLLLRCMDFANARNKGIPVRKWATRTMLAGEESWERDLILPPGWMSRFPRLGMAPIARAIRGWRRSSGDGPTTLAMTYPQYLTLRDQVTADRTIYYNIDDYRLYWPGRAAEVEALELRAVRESTLTVCVARRRADELRAAVPEAASKIVHLPHGAPQEAISPDTTRKPAPAPEDIAGLPRPLLGYVGSLEDRVDWELLDRLAESFPAASIVLVGKVSDGADASWSRLRSACLTRPNVHAIGHRPQGMIHSYNRAFDVGLIPYLTHHPFNVACCPTKLMDGIAAARPMVSTALPECLLHVDRIDVAESASDFVSRIASIIDRGGDDGRGEVRLGHARANTCRIMVGRVLDELERVAGE